MRRDDFLNRTLPEEIELFQEIAPCDEEGARWLKRRWIDYERNWGTDLRPVAVLLSSSVIEQLNVACVQKNGAQRCLC